VVAAVVRLADLLAGLSRAADFGFGLPPGEALRSAALAAVLGTSLDLPDDDVRAALYTALLLHLGCIGYAHETTAVFGDELAFNAAVARTNVADPRDVLTTFVPALLRGHPPLTRASLAFVAVTRGRRFGQLYETAACEVGRDSARRLGLGDTVQQSVYHSYEWWNGRGIPTGLAGEDVPMGSRLAVLATTAVIFDTVGGVDLAVEAVRRQAGDILDPGLGDAFAHRAKPLLKEVNSGDPRTLVLEAEPRPVMSVPGPQLLEVAAVFGDIADLKTPYTHGHSREVATLARVAGERMRLNHRELTDLAMAARLHDIGRVAVSTTIWEKSAALSAHEWEEVRLHPYHSERILAGSERLASVASLVGLHHERLDGSGYHRGCKSADLPAAARIIAAADAYQAMTQRRPHRAALAPERARECMLDDARVGLLDPDAVGAVLVAAGLDADVRRSLPAGLTDREVEVLQLVANGCSNRQIAERLVISRRTAEHHVQHIYTKIGASSRPAAAMFAMEHDLLSRPNR
jgi:HD-GYP domain-containing protein (c-di-GMP phosphodiesterase class II)/DNA-binding CsgD family transcriptional regulator